MQRIQPAYGRPCWIVARHDDVRVRRFPHLDLAALAGDVPWKRGSAVWGLAALPVAF